MNYLYITTSHRLKKYAWNAESEFEWRKICIFSINPTSVAARCLGVVENSEPRICVWVQLLPISSLTTDSGSSPTAITTPPPLPVLYVNVQTFPSAANDSKERLINCIPAWLIPQTGWEMTVKEKQAI